MKLKIKITTILLFLSAATMQGQRPVISLSFTGTANGHYTQLSQVDIRNPDKNCDTILNWPDTVLSLNTLGINDILSSNGGLQVFQNTPNPVEVNTSVRMYIPETGFVQVQIFDLSGRVIISWNKELKRGSHTFLFTPGNRSTYLFTVIHKTETRSIKIAVATKLQPPCSLSYAGMENNEDNYKAAGATVKFQYSLGDRLSFTAIHNGLATTIEDTHATSNTYMFNFSIGYACPGMPTVLYGGQTYNTVQIGTQCWFRENLNVGTRINGSQEQLPNSVIEKYCVNDLESNCAVYGGLYQWDEMMQYITTEGAQGICPTGWHLPTESDWTSLSTFLGAVAGGKIKSTGTLEAGTGLWKTPNTGATNESGFMAVPGGYRHTLGLFSTLGDHSIWWNSSKSGVGNAGNWYVDYSSGNLARHDDDRNYGLAVRCLKD